MQAGKLLIFGHKGMLGRVVLRRSPGATGLDLPECDITDPRQVEDAVQSLKPEVILNCAAFTRVDDAEREEPLATRINGEAVGHLARAAARVGAWFLTISTDYVFDGGGETPFSEEHPPAPRSAYGRGKLVGERAVQAVGGRWCIARTQWLYGDGGKNFIDTVRVRGAERGRLKVVDDQVGAPTWTEDLAEILLALAEQRVEGIVHTANDGHASWYKVACFVIEKCGIDCVVEPCGSAEYPLPAPRPHNSRLCLDRLAGMLGHRPRHWRDALEAYLASRPDPSR